MSASHDVPAAAEPEVTGTGTPVSPFQACRRRLANRRWHRIERFEHKGIDYDLTVGFYEDGLVGEIFIDPVTERTRVSFKIGSDIEGEIDNQAEMASRLLQYGVRPSVLLFACTQGTLVREALKIAARLEAERDGIAPERMVRRLARMTADWLRSAA